MVIDPNTPWHKHPLVVFDTETTGFPNNGARIVEIGIACFIGGQCVSTWGTLLNPGEPIPESASKIHGITDSDVADAPSFLDVLPAVLYHMSDGWPTAYNATFDRAMWRNEMEIADIDLPPHVMFDESLSWLDPLTWIRHIDGGWGNKLTQACKRHGVDIENAHRATDDAKATGELIYKVQDRMPQVSMGDLMIQQWPLCKQQDDERRAWFKKKGRACV